MGHFSSALASFSWARGVNSRSRLARAVIAALLLASASTFARAQVASVSAWDSADFRIWGYIPYWATSSQINAFATNGMYTHVSDVLYFGAVRPQADGDLTVVSTYAPTLATLRSQSASNGFDLHLSMMAVDGSSVATVWNTLSASPTARANFVTQLKTLMLGDPANSADDIRGMNFDYERPVTATEWGNYTQLAREVRAAFKNPATPSTNDWEVTVCDYGSTDSDWDATSLFDAKVYDQLFMMVYHIGASSSATWANTKLTLTQQGAAKAFSDDQIGIGVGTWGTGGPATVTLENIVAANPSLPYDALSFTGTIKDINGVTQTGTWTIESRKQVREKTQLALDRNMPGTFTWTLHYDATNNLGLHRVMHHYTMVKRNVPDLNLDGKVNASDATALANNMGLAITNTGMTTAAQFDAFYLAGNWEKGDHDGNGFVNQPDADWLAARYTALGVTLPDRLAFTGTFENFGGATGLAGRWKMGRNGVGQLLETSNINQHGANYLTWTGSGVGASRRSNQFITIRNQTATEAAAGVNNAARNIQANLTTNIDLGEAEETYVTFLVRENTGSLSAAQLASNQRTLTLNFLNSSAGSQFALDFRGLEHEFGIDHIADAAGQDISTGGFNSDTTYLFLAKISGNGSVANTIQASLLPSGSLVSNFTLPDFQWMLTAQSSGGFIPIINDLQFVTQPEGNFTISNVWIGSAASILPPTKTSLGDFDQDGVVTSADYVVWRNTVGSVGAGLLADANGDNQVNDTDLAAWSANFGNTIVLPASASAAAVPEPSGIVVAVLAICAAINARRRYA
jgi:hypothetical protein